MRNLIGIAALATIAVLIGAPASAADMALKAAPASAASPGLWTGLYAGVDAGYSSNKVGIFDPAAPIAGTATATAPTGTLGGHLGYLYQLYKPIAVGVEGDVSWLDGNGSGPFPGAPVNGILVTNKWDSSIRGVAGVAVDRALLYGTGGWSWSGGSMCGVAPFPAPLTCFPGSSGPGTVGGWIAGGGVAYAFTSNLIGRVEYLHADYGPFRYNGVWTGGFVNVTDTTDTVRVGVSWKFRVP